MSFFRASLSLRSSRARLACRLVSLSVLGVLAASCTKSSSNKTSKEPGAASNIQPVGNSGKSESERRKERAEFEALQARLKALEGQRPNVTPSDVRVSGDVTLPKSLLGKDLLWGSDMQYAKVLNFDSGGFEASTVFALTTKLASFKRVGDTLLLLSQDSLDVESDYPAQNVLARFLVVGESTDGLSLKPDALGMESAGVIGDWLGFSPYDGAKAFVRSMEFDVTDNTLVFEITFRDVSGSQFDFIESVRPRAHVVGNAKGLEMVEPEPGRENDPTHFPTLLKRLGTFPVTAWLPQANTDANDLSAVAKVPTTHVSRFDISEGKEIAWWVTSNIPDTLLPEIKAGVEGWNRYFHSVRPEKPVMVFKGKLPSNVKLGDPRYNVVLFDAVADAPAAYESQSSDPLTGIQTHSLIYLPLAWYNISGARYLDGADASASASSSTARNKDAFLNVLRSKGVVRCERPGVDMRDAVFMAHSRAADSADEAGRALIRSTLLHEVGHALGMAHNFKGTLTGDVSKYNETDWVYSSTTMDYNPFAMEDTLFTDLSNPDRDVTKGLRQPYDAQFIDIVYGGGKQTMESREPAFPYCDDADHEDTSNGVDPFCRQYDFFASPDQALAVPGGRLASQESYLPAKLGGFVTLKGYLGEQAQELLKNAGLKADAAGAHANQNSVSVVSSDDFAVVASAFTQAAESAFRHFLRSGSYSYVSALTRESRLLGEWKPVDGVEKGTEVSFFSGLEFAANFIKNLFSQAGSIRGDAFKAYERKVQNSLSASMASLFSTGMSAESGVFSGKGEVYAAVKIVREAQASLLAELLERVPESEKSVAADVQKRAVQALDSSLNANVSAASARVLQELSSVVVSDPSTGGSVSARPTIRGELSHTLAMGLVALAKRSTVDNNTRLSALNRVFAESENANRFASEQTVTVTRDGAKVKMLASELRAEAMADLAKSVREEFSVLDSKVKANRYLTADERASHEFLATMLQSLGEETL